MADIYLPKIKSTSQKIKLSILNQSTSIAPPQEMVMSLSSFIKLFFASAVQFGYEGSLENFKQDFLCALNNEKEVLFCETLPEAGLQEILYVDTTTKEIFFWDGESYKTLSCDLNKLLDCMSLGQSEDGKLEIKNYDVAQEGQIPTKTEDGLIWVDPFENIEEQVKQLIHFEIPIATNDQLGIVQGSLENNEIQIKEQGKMVLNAVSSDKFIDAEDTELILYGGNALG